MFGGLFIWLVDIVFGDVIYVDYGLFGVIGVLFI